MMSKKSILVLSVLSILMMSYQNCSKVNFSNQPEESSKPSLVGGPNLGGPTTTPRAPAEEPKPISYINSLERNASVLICDKEVHEITSAGDGSKIVVVGGKINNITKVGKGAEVILINTSIKSITNIEKDAQIRLVNTAMFKFVANEGNVIKGIEDEEILYWQASCATLPENLTDVYDSNVIADDSQLNVETDIFRVNVIGARARVSVIADYFIFTKVSPDAVVEIH